jgi:hypothetical protein
MALKDIKIAQSYSNIIAGPQAYSCLIPNLEFLTIIQRNLLLSFVA